MSLSVPRPSSDHQRIALKSACRAAIRRAGGLEAFAVASRVGKSTLQRDCSPDHPAAFLALDVALDLDLDAGAPLIAGALAEAQGWRLVSASDHAGTACSPSSPPCVSAALLAVAREIGDVVPSVMGALADGRFTAAERAQALAEIDELLAPLYALRGAIHRHEPKTPASLDRGS
jgi:hypothetical protein